MRCCYAFAVYCGVDREGSRWLVGCGETQGKHSRQVLANEAFNRLIGHPALKKKETKQKKCTHQRQPAVFFWAASKEMLDRGTRLKRNLEASSNRKHRRGRSPESNVGMGMGPNLVLISIDCGLGGGGCHLVETEAWDARDYGAENAARFGQVGWPHEPATQQPNIWGSTHTKKKGHLNVRSPKAS